MWAFSWSTFSTLCGNLLIFRSYLHNNMRCLLKQHFMRVRQKTRVGEETKTKRCCYLVRMFLFSARIPHNMNTSWYRVKSTWSWGRSTHQLSHTCQAYNSLPGPPGDTWTSAASNNLPLWHVPGPQSAAPGLFQLGSSHALLSWWPPSCSLTTLLTSGMKARPD